MTPTQKTARIKRLFMDIVIDAQDGYKDNYVEDWKIDLRNIKNTANQIQEILTELE